MFELIIDTDFAAAHNLRGYKGQCENLHGHNWKVQVVLKSEKLDNIGMVIDFREAKNLIGDVTRKFDHTYLNDMEHFKAENPTTENISRMIYRELTSAMPSGIKVEKVTTWESDRCGATYFE